MDKPTGQVKPPEVLRLTEAHLQNHTSQCGEDGIIAAMFAHVRTLPEESTILFRPIRLNLPPQKLIGLGAILLFGLAGLTFRKSGMPGGLVTAT